MGSVNVEKAAGLAVGVTVLGRPFFAGWEAKNRGVEQPQFT